MKFTDGFWLIRDGFKVQYGKHVQAARITENQISCLVTPKVVTHRGETLNTAAINLEIDSPLADVIRVNIAHHKGGEAALKFDVASENPTVDIKELENKISIKSGRLEAKLKIGTDFSLDFLAEGKVLTKPVSYTHLRAHET